jgi:hypothetical protein
MYALFLSMIVGCTSDIIITETTYPWLDGRPFDGLEEDTDTELDTDWGTEVIYEAILVATPEIVEIHASQSPAAVTVGVWIDNIGNRKPTWVDGYGHFPDGAHFGWTGGHAPGIQGTWDNTPIEPYTREYVEIEFTPTAPGYYADWWFIPYDSGIGMTALVIPIHGHAE